MKRILPVIILVVVITLIVTLITINIPNKGIRYLTVNRHYSYVYTETKKLEIPFYSNNEKNPLSNSINYSSVYLSSADQNKRLSLEIVSIDKGIEEQYISEQYYQFLLILMMPKLSSDFFIDDCYLEIRLSDYSEYVFKIGRLSLYYQENVGAENLFSLQALSGMKGDVILSRLAEIKLEGLFSDSAEITKITVGHGIKTSFYVDNDLIMIQIDYQELMLDNVPIIIEYKDGQNIEKQVIDNFRYFTDYDILTQNGILVNVY